ncbi:MAG: hypothetical protein HOV81_05910 [Kofleriaceae bacterium]|nr:hypothetical protein [Kofleriaceae bacterium]
MQTPGLLRDQLEARFLGLMFRYRQTLDRLEDGSAANDQRVADMMSESDARELERVIAALYRLDDQA